MKWFALLILLVSVQVRAQQSDSALETPQLVWVEKLEADFSFTSQWSYAEGVYVNEFGQVSCDGFCPERTWTMIDSMGRIITDSLKVFYTLVDTNHFYHTLQCESSCREFAGTDFIDVTQLTADSFFCQTRNTVATHCSLYVTFGKKTMKAGVRLNSIIRGGGDSYDLVNGVFRVEEKTLKEGFLKAEFYLTFWNNVDGDASEYIYWKGLIHAPVKK